MWFFRSAKDYHDVLHSSPLLRKACARRVVLDECFPLDAGHFCSRERASPNPTAVAEGPPGAAPGDPKPRASLHAHGMVWYGKVWYGMVWLKPPPAAFMVGCMVMATSCGLRRAAGTRAARKRRRRDRDGPTVPPDPSENVAGLGPAFTRRW